MRSTGPDKSCFQTWTPENVHTNGSGLSPEFCLSHMNGAAVNSLLGRVHNNTEISRSFRGGVAQHAGDHVFSLAALFTTEIFQFFCFFFQFCICNVLETSSPLACGKSSTGSPAEFLRGLDILRSFYWGSVRKKPWNTQKSVFKPTAPPENIRRLSEFSACLKAAKVSFNARKCPWAVTKTNTHTHGHWDVSFMCLYVYMKCERHLWIVSGSFIFLLFEDLTLKRNCSGIIKFSSLLNFYVLQKLAAHTICGFINVAIYYRNAKPQVVECEIFFHFISRDMFTLMC